MSESSLFHVLQFVRSIRDGRSNGFSDGNAMVDVLKILWDLEPSSSDFLRALAAMQDHVEKSIITVTTDERIDGEGKDGIVTTLAQIKGSLSVGGMGSPLNGYYPNLAVTLSQISLVVGLYGIKNSPYSSVESEIEQLIVDLAQELDRLVEEQYSDVREFAIKQIRAIISLLRNINVFGPESSYAAYFQLALSVKRAREGSSENDKVVAERIWPSIERWAGRLAIIEAAVTHSQTLLIAGKQALLLLGTASG